MRRRICFLANPRYNTLLNENRVHVADAEKLGAGYEKRGTIAGIVGRPRLIRLMCASDQRYYDDC